jgi:hypothetical protein
MSVFAPDAALPVSADVTNAVVATCVVFVPPDAVVAVAAPKAGAASDVMSVFAPKAAAPSAVRAAAAVVPPVPPLATGSAAVPSRNVCKPLANDWRMRDITDLTELLIFALGQPSAMLIPSTVVLEFAVVDQSNKLGIFYSPIKNPAEAGSG